MMHIQRALQIVRAKVAFLSIYQIIIKYQMNYFINVRGSLLTITPYHGALYEALMRIPN